MRVIVNADDFGASEDSVEATIECFARGALTSATIMPKMPATNAALRFALDHPEFSFGVHLTWVSDGIESPVSCPKDIPALVGPDGKFLPANRVRMLALMNRLPTDQIEREATAQIALLRDAGLQLSHVDSHGHMHKFGPFRRALMKVLPRFGLRKVRNVQNIYLTHHMRSPTYWLGFLWQHKLERAFSSTKYFFMPASDTDRSWATNFKELSLDGVIEVGTHPGHTEPWRDAQRLALLGFSNMIRENGHQLITWRDV